MKLTVETLNAKVQQTIVLDVELDYEVSYVKFLLHDRTNIAFANQALLADGQVLCDSLRLVDCHFIGDRTIHLLLIEEYLSKSLGDNFKVIIKTLTGKNIELEVRPGDRVKYLKVKLEEKEGIPQDLLRVILNGKQLEDEQVLADLGVREGSVIHLVLCLRGGSLPHYNLQFRTLTGKTIPMGGMNETVKMAIERVWKLEGIRAGNELTFNNEPLDNEKLLHTVERYTKEGSNIYQFEQDSILEFRNKPCTRAKDELKVYVKFPEGEIRKALVLIVKASHSVRSLKSAIESEASGRVVNLKPAGEDRELEDDRNLSDYAVQSEMMLYATLKLKLFVRWLDNGTIFRLDVQSGDRTENIKERIHHQERIPTDVQVLSFGTRRLEDDELVDEICFEGRRTSPVLGLEVKSVRDLQIRISPKQWPFELRTCGVVRPISLSIKSNETIREVKSRIANKHNRLPVQQHLYFNGEQLVDSCTLDQLGVQNRVGLSFAPRWIAFKISITSVGINRRKFEVEVDSDDTIKYVKSKIEQLSTDSYQRMHFSTERQTLTYEGQLLENDRTLQNYRIGAGSELSMSLRVVELEVSVQTEFVEKRILKVRSDCTWEMFVSEVRKLGLSICSDNDCYPPWYHMEDLSELIVRKPVMIKQTAYCNECPGCARIKAFKQVAGLN